MKNTRIVKTIALLLVISILTVAFMGGCDNKASSKPDNSSSTISGNSSEVQNSNNESNNISNNNTDAVIVKNDDGTWFNYGECRPHVNIGDKVLATFERFGFTGYEWDNIFL